MAGEQFGSPAYSGEGKFPMNELANDVSYSELRAELQALRKKLEDLETRQSAIKPSGRGTLRQRFPRTFLVASILLSVLFVGSGLLWGDQAIQALIVDKDGNVRINGVVGIGRAPIADQSLLVTPKVGNIPLNVTNPGNTINWLTVLSDGKVLMNGGGVGIGTSPTEGNKLSVKGDADFSGKVGVGITKPDATLDVGGNLHAAGNVNPSTGSQGAYLGWNALSGGTGETDFINSKGGGPGGFAFMQAGDPRATLMFINGAGRVGIGTTDPQAKLQVAGDALIDGKVSSKGRYQRDDEAETTYQIPPPYHLSLTAKNYLGRTKTIPQDVLESLCGTASGCEVRLAMTKWDSDTKTESASRVFWFYYSKTDGRWRTSEDAVGIAGQGGTQHAKDIWGTCFFTDGNYSNFKDLGSRDRSMKLLVWNDNKSPNRTCELTITK